MCTAVTFNCENFYFGRNLDYHLSFGEEVVITPRKFRLKFRETQDAENHYAMIGMAHIEGNYPLYYDAVNEKGLCMAALNFVGNAKYAQSRADKINLTHFEFISYILANCESVEGAREVIEKINITDKPFSNEFSVSELHWIIADSTQSITVEAVCDGIKIYDNPIGVLTNNPPFPQQMFRLNDYLMLSNKQPKNSFSKKIDLKTYSLGMGAIGLPGDLSSASRFVRAAFVKLNAVCGETQEEDVSQFFHILSSVEQVSGCNDIGGGRYEKTIYSSCCNADEGIYYYKTYNSLSVSRVDMKKENLDTAELIRHQIKI